MKIFRRKIYDSLLEWENTSGGRSAVLIEGAKGVGKSTIVREFAEKEYRSCIFIDFSAPPVLASGNNNHKTTENTNQRLVFHGLLELITQ